MMKYLSRFVFLIFCLSSCTSTLRNIESQHGFNKVLVEGNEFWITTYQKITDTDKPYVYYIEGDGAAFFRKRPSINPTPRREMLIDLAVMDTRPNVIYVARPCQYTPKELNPKCNDFQYWTQKRMSEEVVESLNTVINKINNKYKFHLVGYSGGGGVAVLIAARNNMVEDIITISANLDHKAFTEFHKVAPMTNSLNPIDYAEQVKHVPQLHISGGDDDIVPPSIATKYVEKSNSNCVTQMIFKDNSHKHGWQNTWKQIYNKPLNKCTN